MTYDFRFASGKKPLYGHTSPDNAYVQDDYPHGFRDRCKRRTWLEFKAKQGWRIVHQTSQPWYPGSGESAPPDSELRWAKPKASTYVGVAGCMYLDGQDHVQWEALHYSAIAQACESFMHEFPKADFSGIKMHAFTNVKYAHGMLHGATAWVINGQPKPWSESDLEKARKDLGAWIEIAGTSGLKFKADFLQECKDLVDGKTPAKLIDPEAWKAEQKQKDDAEAAAKIEKADNTKGALTAAEFGDLLNKKIDAKDRNLNVDASDGYVRVNLYNAPKSVRGADAENNRFAWIIDGFDRKNPDIKAVKVKLVERINNGAPREDRAKWALRGKSGTPQQIAEYLTKHIHKIVAEIEPKLAKLASYDRSQERSAPMVGAPLS